MFALKILSDKQKKKNDALLHPTVCCLFANSFLIKRNQSILILKLQKIINFTKGIDVLERTLF